MSQRGHPAGPRGAGKDRADEEATEDAPGPPRAEALPVARPRRSSLRPSAAQGDAVPAPRGASAVGRGAASPRGASAQDLGALGGATVEDPGYGESTSADPAPDLRFDDATAPAPRKATRAGADAVQIDAVMGERVPAIVVRRSGPEPKDPASRVSNAVAVPAPVELDRLMGRAIGSPVPQADGRAFPDPASRRSLPALGAEEVRPLVALDEPPSRRSLPALGADDVRPRAEVPSRRSLPAQGSRTEAGREVTHIDAAAALGLAPEPVRGPARSAVPAPDAPGDLTPPPALVLPSPGRGGPEAARGPLPGSPPEGAARRAPLPPPRAVSMPARALRGDPRRSGWLWVFATAAIAGVVLLAVARHRARRSLDGLPAATAARDLARLQAQVPDGERGIRLLTRPLGALVEIDGRAVGPAPMLLRPTDDRRRFTVRVRAAGFRPWEGVLVLDATGERVSLERGPSAEVHGVAEAGGDSQGPSVFVALEHE